MTRPLERKSAHSLLDADHVKVKDVEEADTSKVGRPIYKQPNYSQGEDEAGLIGEDGRPAKKRDNLPKRNNKPVGERHDVLEADEQTPREKQMTEEARK